MDFSSVWSRLVRPVGGNIVYVVIDGLGGLAGGNGAGTEMQTAATPNLDRLAAASACGLLEMVGPGITPGSGPGHLALFGYDPLNTKIGRGILAALGIGFELKVGDVAARVNFATADAKGRITDRRAGRISTDTSRRLCDKIREKVRLDFEGEFFFETVREHRAALILRGADLGGNLRDTDPQKTGMPPHEPEALREDSQKTEGLVRSLVHQVREILSNEEKANTILLRGFDSYKPLASLQSLFGLTGLCIASYPMYQGISRLLGMKVLSPEEKDFEASFTLLEQAFGDDYDFYFLHIKETDSSGEDGDFHRKAKALEAVDQLIPRITNLEPDVLVVTGDHSTPAVMGAHSWHPVPVLIQGKYARVDRVTSFDEEACLRGSLGQRPGVHLMGLALAHAGRLRKFGA
jgi:2,3-bisphosphoglycerate-independent phosphoglycerate mutase